ncbi:hypothetical protein DFJ73DRAFT_880308, partial [Zopfochytrium polystomum]
MVRFFYILFLTLRSSSPLAPHRRHDHSRAHRPSVAAPPSETACVSKGDSSPSAAGRGTCLRGWCDRLRAEDGTKTVAS